MMELIVAYAIDEPYSPTHQAIYLDEGKALTKKGICGSVTPILLVKVSSHYFEIGTHITAPVIS